MHRGNSCILNEALSYQYCFDLIRIRMIIWMGRRWIIKIRSNWNFLNFPNRNIFFEKKNEYSIKDPITRDFLYYSSLFKKKPNERYGATNLWDYFKSKWVKVYSKSRYKHTLTYTRNLYRCAIFIFQYPQFFIVKSEISSYSTNVCYLFWFPNFEQYFVKVFIEIFFYLPINNPSFYQWLQWIHKKYMEEKKAMLLVKINTMLRVCECMFVCFHCKEKTVENKWR